MQRGIELLRDDGLRYNPDDVLIHRELAWFFQHKMGANLDDANMYYKQEWAKEMAEVFGMDKPNLDELINPKTDDAKKRVAIAARKIQDGSRFHEAGGRALRPAGMAAAGGARDLLGGQGLGRGQEERAPDQSEGFDHPAPR